MTLVEQEVPAAAEEVSASSFLVMCYCPIDTFIMLFIIYLHF